MGRKRNYGPGQRTSASSRQQQLYSYEQMNCFCEVWGSSCVYSSSGPWFPSSVLEYSVQKFQYRAECMNTSRSAKTQIGSAVPSDVKDMIDHLDDMCTSLRSNASNFLEVVKRYPQAGYCASDIYHQRDYNIREPLRLARDLLLLLLEPVNDRTLSALPENCFREGLVPNMKGKSSTTNCPDGGDQLSAEGNGRTTAADPGAVGELNTPTANSDSDNGEPISRCYRLRDRVVFPPLIRSYLISRHRCKLLEEGVDIEEVLQCLERKSAVNHLFVQIPPFPLHANRFLQIFYAIFPLFPAFSIVFSIALHFLISCFSKFSRRRCKQPHRDRSHYGYEPSFASCCNGESRWSICSRRHCRGGGPWILPRCTAPCSQDRRLDGWVGSGHSSLRLELRYRLARPGTHVSRIWCAKRNVRHERLARLCEGAFSTQGT